MKRNNRAFLYVVYLAIGGSLLLGSKCKKDPDPDPDPDGNPITCSSNIQDGCFDDWKVIHTSSGDYINPTADYMQTLNELSSLPAAAGGPGPVTADTVTDCMQGKYAIKLISGTFSPLGTPIFIPGYVGTSVLDIPYGTIHLGKPYSQRPVRFQGYYKYQPANGDSAMIEVMLTRYNSGAGKRDTVSFDKMIIKNAVPNYTQLDFPLTYWDNVNNPDTLVIIFASSSDVRFNDLMGCSGQLGSTMWVDDLKFVLP